jgi:hypothetical protein
MTPYDLDDYETDELIDELENRGHFFEGEANVVYVHEFRLSKQSYDFLRELVLTMYPNYDTLSRNALDELEKLHRV